MPRILIVDGLFLFAVFASDSPMPAQVPALGVEVYVEQHRTKQYEPILVEVKVTNTSNEARAYGYRGQAGLLVERWDEAREEWRHVFADGDHSPCGPLRSAQMPASGVRWMRGFIWPVHVVEQAGRLRARSVIYGRSSTGQTDCTIASPWVIVEIAKCAENAALLRADSRDDVSRWYFLMTQGPCVSLMPPSSARFVPVDYAPRIARCEVVLDSKLSSGLRRIALLQLADSLANASFQDERAQARIPNMLARLMEADAEGGTTPLGGLDLDRYVWCAHLRRILDDRAGAEVALKQLERIAPDSANFIEHAEGLGTLRDYIHGVRR